MSHKNGHFVKKKISFGPMRVTKKLNLNIFLGLVVMGFQSNVMVFHGFCLVQIVVLGEPVKTYMLSSPTTNAIRQGYQGGPE